MRWDPADCRACELGSLELPRCVGYGSKDDEVAIVGINPSVRATDGVLGSFLVPYHAVFQRRLRVPGSLLYRGAARAHWHLAIEADLDLGVCYSTNAVKCATPGNRRPTVKEISTCARKHLSKELRDLPNLRKVIVYGRAAGDVLGLSEFGEVVEVEGTTAEAILLRHPIATLRRWTKLDERATEIREFLGDFAPAPPY